MVKERAPLFPIKDTPPLQVIASENLNVLIVVSTNPRTKQVQAIAGKMILNAMVKDGALLMPFPDLGLLLQVFAPENPNVTTNCDYDESKNYDDPMTTIANVQDFAATGSSQAGAKVSLDANDK
jgi:hypothetical protein